MALTALFGAAVERLFLRGVARGGVLKMIVTTIGLSIVIREAALLAWGESVRTLPFFSGNEVSSVSFLGANFSPQVFWVVGVTALVVSRPHGLLPIHDDGQGDARLLGEPRRREPLRHRSRSHGHHRLRPERGHRRRWPAASSLPSRRRITRSAAALAIKGFTVAAFGGLGNSVAAVVAGLFLGMLESFSIFVVPEAYKDVVSICVLLAVLFVKPPGSSVRARPARSRITDMAASLERHAAAVPRQSSSRGPPFSCRRLFAAAKAAFSSPN